MRYAKLDAKGFPLAFYLEAVNGPLQIPVYGAPPAPTEDEPNPPAPVTGYTRNPAIPPGVIPITDEQWMELLTYPGLRRWNGSRVVAYP